MSQFILKIRQLERAERKIQKHLARLDKQLVPLQAEKAELESLLNATQEKIHTIQSALHILAKSEPLDLGKFAHRVFHGKVNQLLIRILKANPNTAYQARELAAEMLILDNQPDTILNERHTEAARKVLGKLHEKGVITKTVITPNVYWQWKTKSEVA